jgi:hypothetical protein
MKINKEEALSKIKLGLSNKQGPEKLLHEWIISEYDKVKWNGFHSFSFGDFKYVYHISPTNSVVLKSHTIDISFEI